MPNFYCQFFTLILVLLTANVAYAWEAPAVPSAGYMKTLTDVAHIPDAKAEHKILIHVTGSPENMSDMYPPLDYVARTVNLYAGAKVPKENLHIALVVSGASTPIVINNERYKKEFGADNPNLTVLNEMKAHGVKIIACGQALEGMKMRDDVHNGVTVAFSALTTVLELQRQGYALLQL